MEITVYVGKYKVPKGGAIPLPNSKLKVLSFYVGTSGRKEVKDDRLTLVVEDGDFWPVICKLTDEETSKLIETLELMLIRRNQVWKDVEVHQEGKKGAGR